MTPVIEPGRVRTTRRAVRATHRRLGPRGRTLGHRPSERSAHVCALDRAGHIECWGGNDSGQTAPVPPWLDDPPDRDIAAGSAHTCAIGASGSLDSGAAADTLARWVDVSRRLADGR